MNIYVNPGIAAEYDMFYETDLGIAVDTIEKRIITSLLEDIPDVPMLELGCGTGHWTEFLTRQGFRITAVDYSEEMLKIARQKSIKNAVFLEGDAAKLPFPDQSFSAIISITMLEFTDDPNIVLNEIDRVLKPDGQLILGCLNSESEIGKNKDNDDVFRHARFFSRDEVKQMLFRFGESKLDAGVYYSSKFEVLDGTEKQYHTQPAFIGAIVQKKQKNEDYSRNQLLSDEGKLL